MVDFGKSHTKENLARSFAAECQDGARYQFISKSAKADGFMFISDTMKILAKNEMAHASRFYEMILKYSGGSGSKNIDISAGYPFDNFTLPEGLRLASEVEKSESKNIYPSFAKIANDEGFKDVGDLFTLVAMTENCHNMLLTELYEKFTSKMLYELPEKNKWKCSNCGHEHTDKKAWKECPLCTYPQGYVQIPLADE